MPVTEAQVLDALRPVEDPELHRSIVDLGMVAAIAIDRRPGRRHRRPHRGRLPAASEITERVTERGRAPWPASTTSTSTSRS